MPVLRQIAQLGHEVLRNETREINNINDLAIQSLIDDMLVTVKDVNGVGIAANQVYESLRVFIIASHPNIRYPNAPLIEPYALINPKIVSYSEKKIKGWEGCLSVPNIRGFVPRFKTIKVEYFDRWGNYQEKELTDFVAVIFQHEYDHINGMVYLDRVESNIDLISEKEFLKLQL